MNNGYGNNRQQEWKLLEIWPNYLNGGYFDTDGCLRLEYVSRERMEPLANAMASAYPKLSMTQVRRFFGHCRAVETSIRGNTTSDAAARWANAAPDILKLDTAAADGFAKTPAKFPRLFHDFIKSNVKAVHSEKDFLNGFLPHFEALVGFGSQFFERERG